MPEKKTIERARKDAARGRSPSTQAGEFVREEVHHIREGKHGARSTKQAIAIGLSKARRAGVDLPAPRPGTTSESTRRAAMNARRRAGKKKVSERRSRATKKALAHEGRSAASKKSLSRHAKSAAARRSPAERSASARKAARTKGPRARANAAKQAARTRAS